MTGRSFREYGTVTLDGSGNGVVRVAPKMADWEVTRVSISVSSATNEPTFKMYENGISEGDFLEGTWTGSLNTSETRHPLRNGESLLGVWSGGDPGASATMVVRGTAYRQGEMP